MPHDLVPHWTSVHEQVDAVCVGSRDFRGRDERLQVSGRVFAFDWNQRVGFPFPEHRCNAIDGVARRGPNDGGLVVSP